MERWETPGSWCAGPERAEGQLERLPTRAAHDEDDGPASTMAAAPTIFEAQSSARLSPLRRLLV